MSVNKAIIVGRVGQDPEASSSSGGTAIAKLSVATNSKRKSGTDWVDEVEWHRVVCFGKVAENVTRFLKKGREVYIEGKIKTRKWQDRSGADRWTTEIVADVVQFLGSGGQRDAEPEGYSNDKADDDVPF